MSIRIISGDFYLKKYILDAQIIGTYSKSENLRICSFSRKVLTQTQLSLAQNIILLMKFAIYVLELVS